MTFLRRVQEANSKLNDRFFPRSQLRYVDRFRQLAVELSANDQVVLHLGSGRKDLEPLLEKDSDSLLLLNLDIGYDDLSKNPGRFKVCGNAEVLPLPPKSVDLICSERVFEHFPQPERVLKECCRVLKDGGYLLVSGPNGWSYVALAARLTPLGFHNLVRRLGSGSNGNGADGFATFYRFSTPSTMRRLARKAGFELVTLQTFVGEPCYTTFLPLFHLAFVAYHKLLEKLHPLAPVISRNVGALWLRG